VPPCGGCRQKLAEFAKGPVTVTLLATSGAQERTMVADLLPGAFDQDHLTSGAEDPKA
jgi:cytidine deaminase